MNKRFNLLLGALLAHQLVAQDLEVTQVRTPVPSVIQAEEILAITYVRNNGGADANNYNVGYYLSADAIYDLNDLYLGTWGSMSTKPGSTDSSYTKPFIYWNVKPGNYYLIAKADYQNFIRETNENNNTNATEITVVKRQFDLRISSLTLQNTLVAQGGKLYPVTTETITGNAYAHPHYIGYHLSKDSILSTEDVFLSKSEMGFGYIGTLNDNPTITIHENTAPGEYYLIANADEDAMEHNAETDETNNTRAIKINVQYPVTDIDLTVFKSYYNNPRTAPGNKYTTSATIKNLGAVSVPKVKLNYYLSKDAQLSADDSLFAAAVSENLNSSGTADHSVVWNVPATQAPGDYYLIADVPTAGLTETNAANNRKAFKITVEALTADLVVTGVSLRGVNTSPGSVIYPVTHLKNTGNIIANSTITYFLSGDAVLDAADQEVSSMNVSLYPVQSSEYASAITLDQGMATGTYFLFAVADYKGTVKETNENNNISSMAFVVEKQNIDLSITLKNSEEVTVKPDTTIYFSVFEKNLGTTFSDEHYIKYYLSKDPVFDSKDSSINLHHSMGLSGGETDSLTTYVFFYHQVKAGTYYLIARTENLKPGITDINTKNNEAILRLVVQPLDIDFTVSANPTSTAVTPGKYFTLTGTVFNSGTDKGYGQRLGFYYSTDDKLDDSDILTGEQYVESVAPNSSFKYSANVYVPADAPQGKIYILAVADYLNYLSEKNDSNNVYALEINTGESNTDLTLYTTEFPYYTEFNSGETISFKIEEKNSGSAYSSYHQLGFLLSKDNVPDSTDLFLSKKLVYGFVRAEHRVSVTIPAGTVPGNYYLFTIADYTDTIAESNENNNWTYTYISVLKNAPDISVTALTLEDSVLSAGSTVHVSLLNSYPGLKQVDQYGIQFYISADSRFDTTDTNISYLHVFKPNQDSVIVLTTEVTIPDSLRSGVYYLLAVSDQEKRVTTELNRDNNTTAVRFFIGNQVVTDLETASIKSQVAVYPNPTSGILHVTSAKADEMEVTDVSGNILLVQKIRAGMHTTLDLSALTPGMYHIRTRNNGEITSVNRIAVTKE